jgi:hypothetical protein
MTTVEIFKKMLNWLYANKKAGNQTDVARKSGLNEVTVSRILNGRVKKAKQETLWAVNVAYGNIFNPDWLRGESDVMLVADLVPVAEFISSTMHGYAQQPDSPDMSSMINAIIAAKDETIAGRDAMISSLQQQVSDLRQQVADLRKTLAAAQSKDMLKDPPFPLGAAEDESRQQPERK